MHRASRPKETRHQWPPIAAERRGRRGACNQSINIGGSLGERSNLMSHTHRDTPPPSFHFLLLLLLSAFSLTSSLDPSLPPPRPPRRPVTRPSCFPDQDRPGSVRFVPSLPRWHLLNSRGEGDGARTHTHTQKAGMLLGRGGGRRWRVEEEEAQGDKRWSNRLLNDQPATMMINRPRNYCDKQ